MPRAVYDPAARAVRSPLGDRERSLSDQSSLAGKVAVVTGSTQGLGEATVRLFAKRGAAGIVVTGRNAERGKAVVAALKGLGTKAVFVAADVEKVAGCRKIIAAADKAFGRLDILVNAAGLTDRGSIWDTTAELFDRMMAVNVRAPFFLMQEAIRLMERDKVHGSIVNISSVAAHGSVPMLVAYAASKAALNTLTKNVAYSVMRRRIRANALNIGWMDTPGEHATQRRFHARSKDWLKAVEAERPFGRLLKPDEVARAIAFLASDESGMMTGAVIDFDQSVVGGGASPLPAPIEEWPEVVGVRYG
ncbi:SDR family oxidoreductase [soil metagenome]